MVMVADNSLLFKKQSSKKAIVKIQLSDPKIIRGEDGQIKLVIVEDTFEDQGER